MALNLINKEFIIKYGVLKKYTGSSESVIIPEGVREIGTRAFNNCKSLKSVYIPKSVNKVGRAAFYGCTGLKNLNLPAKAEVVAPITDNTDIKRYFIPNVDISGLESSDKLNHAIYFLTSAGCHSEKDRDMYVSYIKRQKTRVTNAIIIRKTATALPELLSLKVITVKDIDIFIETANSGDNTEILAMLMEYKRKNFSPDEIERENIRRINKELNYDPMSLSELRKVWRFEEQPDKTIVITSYSGREKEVVIPETIGGQTVTALANYAFSPFKRRVKNKKERAAIKKVTIPDSVTEIKDSAFFGCDSLRIYGKEGSCAERYAKKYQIRFYYI